VRSEGIDHHLEACGVVGNRQVSLGGRAHECRCRLIRGELRRGDGVTRVTVLLPDPFHEARGEHRFVVHVDQLVLE
jgi:hypothetical protein